MKLGIGLKEKILPYHHVYGLNHCEVLSEVYNDSFSFASLIVKNFIY
jgi:hypothetical protein